MYVYLGSENCRIFSQMLYEVCLEYENLETFIKKYAERRDYRLYIQYN